MQDKDYTWAIDALEKAFLERFPRLSAQRLDADHATKLTQARMAAHVYTMIPKMRDIVKTQRYERLNRWLGFAQGFVVASGIRTINECRHMNMPDDREFLPR